MKMIILTETNIPIAHTKNGKPSISANQPETVESTTTPKEKKT